MEQQFSPEEFNAVTHHPLQSYEWGTFREKTGIKVIRHAFFTKKKLRAAIQLTIHRIPKTKWTIGYLPKGYLPDNEMLETLKKIGKEKNCIYIQLEPDVIEKINGISVQNTPFPYQKLGLQKAAHPLFTKYTFLLDLTKSEEELLRSMHPKGRYNIKVANKHGVIVKEDTTKKGFEQYWKLTEETTKRQKFYAHTKNYHEQQFATIPHTIEKNKLTSHLLTAMYDNKVLTTHLFFVYKDTLYYPYGASSSEHRNVMHSNLTMWEGIRFGKKLGLKKFDMWGSMSMLPDTSDPWYGFHNFKEKFGPDHIEFIGSYDLVINPALYKMFKAADKARWLYLKLKKK